MLFYGKLEMNDNAEFELYNEETEEIINITKLLDGIYFNTEKRQAYVKVMNKTSLIYEEDGAIDKRIDQHGILSNFICSENLDLLLFNNTDEYLEITIKERGNINNITGSGNGTK